MISFIVPAYNEARLLGRTLAALHAAAGAAACPYEVIVVDDGSTDGTAAIAESHGARVVRVQYRQIARTRNAGARAAAGGVLVFVDADTVVPAATLFATLDALRDGAAGGGAWVDFDGALPRWARLLLPVMRTTLHVGRLAAGCYVFCTRAAFDAAGGFDERLYAAEEIAFSVELRRHGPVVIVREPVLTSGRKLRSHSGLEVLRLLGSVLRRGRSVVRSRDRLALWYGERRDDPGPF
jgi:glycosyltransferase involved in cell wall biosynthesis